MESTTDNRALLVGVGADLPDTVTDAEALAGILTDPSRCRYPAANVAVLTEGNATRDRVLAALDALAAAAVADATVLIYYSGHGYRVTSSVGESYYLMTHGYDLARLYQTAIGGREWAGRLAAIPAKRLLLLLDCCHAGGLTAERAKAVGLTLAKAPLPPEAEALFARGQGRIRIASSRADEYSLAGKPYSLFTRALIESLSGQGVAHRDGYVRALDLALHAREKVPRWSNRRQTPIVDVEAADNFVVAYYAAGAKSPLPLDLPPVDPAEVARLNGLAGGGDATAGVSVTGGGAVAVGPGAQAAGERGVVIGGNVDGSTIITGDRIDTGGGAFIRGPVNTGGGKFVGRDDVSPTAPPPKVPPTCDGPPTSDRPEKAPSDAPGSPGPDWYQALKEELERLPLGLMMFNPPSRMKLGKAERVEARITQDPGQDLVRALKGRGLPQMETTKVGSLMKVRLTGEAFSIEALDEEAQLVPPRGYTEWAWDVMPVQSGTRTLHLHVTVRIRLPHGEERKDHPVVDRIIQIDVDSIYSIKKWIAEHWQWFLGTLVIPLIAWIWAKLQS